MQRQSVRISSLQLTNCVHLHIVDLLMCPLPRPDGKVLIIGGGIGNFTNVTATFKNHPCPNTSYTKPRSMSVAVSQLACRRSQSLAFTWCVYSSPSKTHTPQVAVQIITLIVPWRLVTIQDRLIWVLD
ncbi:hypothetical protein BDR04DRAFT_113033 [Suillus decipiens]|nr:hypothetical protein BDR04DRAFT_113033 [Suillus decipiens]